MPINDQYPVDTTKLSLVYIAPIKTPKEGGNIDCLAVLTYDVSVKLITGMWAIYFEIDPTTGERKILVVAQALLTELQEHCQRTMLVSFELAEAKKFLQEIFSIAGLDYPFTEGYEIDLRILLACRSGQYKTGLTGLFEEARAAQIKVPSFENTASWGVIASWYVLTHIFDFDSRQPFRR